MTLPNDPEQRVNQRGGIKNMAANRTIDVRGATCPGGGAQWALLSHFREVPKGGSLELRTDDYMAPLDIPAWVIRHAWTVEVRGLPQGRAFLVRRPA
jgi:TusA-related sulfurtransferase